MKNFCVIGANYGDEGKGILTDYLTRNFNPACVIRFNGGAQAGHTVQTDTHRHVFSNFSSGTLVETTTVLGSEVLLNPFSALLEKDKLVATGIKPKRIHVTSESPITVTPFDIEINKIIEDKRRENRHGSCGHGINEAVTRHQAMKAAGITNIFHEGAREWLKLWVARRRISLGIDNVSNQWGRSNFIEEFNDIFDHALVVNEAAWDEVYVKREIYDNEKVYEGAQGLGLDETLGSFPHVTRSNTGIKNALMDLVRCGDNKPLNIYYVTRCYLTRHGNGPLPGETDPEEILGVHFGSGRFVDATNQPNPWQGHLRFAPLDVGTMVERIKSDLSRNQPLIQSRNINVSVVITCTDQPKDSTRLVFTDHGVQKQGLGKMIDSFAKYDIPVSHIFSGPTANDAQILNERIMHV